MATSILVGKAPKLTLQGGLRSASGQMVGQSVAICLQVSSTSLMRDLMALAPGKTLALAMSIT